MRSGRLEALRTSLRFRLTLWNTAVILVLVLTTFLGLRQGLRSFLEHELDRMLREDHDEVRLILERFWPDRATIKEELDRKAVTHKAHHFFARVHRPDGELALATIGAPEESFEPGFTSGGRRARVFTADGWRVLGGRADGAGATEGLVVLVGCRTETVEDDVTNLTRMLVLAGLAFLLVAPVSGYWLAGWATRPLADIAHTAARARPGHLTERVPLRGSGDELDQLAATLNGLLDRLAAHVERQRAFVANAAHELRSPLAALRTSAEVALGQELSAREHRERLADIVEACDHLGVLVNQLLLLAEGESGPVRAAAPVGLDRLAGRIVDMFRGVAETRELGLELVVAPAGGCWVMGSATHLRQVLSNLLDNALKFTPPGGRVTVELKAAGGEVRLAVSDTGVGIAAEDLPHVFERFYRADRSRRREPGGGGFGLGLSICQALVVGHGGQIAIASEPGRGTMVSITLPACAAPGEGNLTEM